MLFFAIIGTIAGFYTHHHLHDKMGMSNTLAVFAGVAAALTIYGIGEYGKKADEREKRRQAIRDAIEDEEYARQYAEEMKNRGRALTSRRRP